MNVSLPGLIKFLPAILNILSHRNVKHCGAGKSLSGTRNFRLSGTKLIF